MEAYHIKKMIISNCLKLYDNKPEINILIGFNKKKYQKTNEQTNTMLLKFEDDSIVEKLVIENTKLECLVHDLIHHATQLKKKNKKCNIYIGLLVLMIIFSFWMF